MILLITTAHNFGNFLFSTRWSWDNKAFYRQHFQMYLVVYKLLSSNYHFAEICSNFLIDNKPALVQIYCMESNRLHMIVWTKDSLFHIFASLSLSKLTWNSKIFCDSLTHWGWVMHICICKLTTIGSDNGLLPGLHQAIIWTNAGILLIGP